MKKILLAMFCAGLFVFTLLLNQDSVRAAIINYQAQTLGDYSPSATSVTCVAGQGSNIPVSNGVTLFWYDGNYADYTQDPYYEAVTLKSKTGDVLTVGRGIAGTAAEFHGAFHTNILEFPVNDPTVTVTPTNSPTNTPTNTPTATPTNTPLPPTATPNIISGTVALPNPLTPTAISNSLFTASTNMVVTEKGTAGSLVSDTFAVTCVSGACSITGSASSATTVFWHAQP